MEVFYNEQYPSFYLRKDCRSQYRYLSLRGYCPLLQIVGDCSVRLCSLNHNKRSVRLDLSRPEGRDVFLQPVPLSPASERGQHTHEVLQELLGMDDDALKCLEQKGVI
jgi:crotonobetainyl-CoA:carnitine CoA-transferase CaiB-like acyl-CoA transferase